MNLTKLEVSIMKGSVSGIFAPIGTPFVDGEVSIEHMKENIRRYK